MQHLTSIKKRISKHKGTETESLFTYLFHNIGLMSLRPEVTSPKKFPHKLQTRSVSHYTCNNIPNGSILVSLHRIDRYIIDLLSTDDLWWFSHCFCGLWFPSPSHRTRTPLRWPTPLANLQLNIVHLSTQTLTPFSGIRY